MRVLFTRFNILNSSDPVSEPCDRVLLSLCYGTLLSGVLILINVVIMRTRCTDAARTRVLVKPRV